MCKDHANNDICSTFTNIFTLHHACMQALYDQEDAPLAGGMSRDAMFKAKHRELVDQARQVVIDTSSVELAVQDAMDPTSASADAKALAKACREVARLLNQHLVTQRANRNDRFMNRDFEDAYTLPSAYLDKHTDVDDATISDDDIVAVLFNDDVRVWYGVVVSMHTRVNSKLRVTHRASINNPNVGYVFKWFDRVLDANGNHVCRQVKGEQRMRRVYKLVPSSPYKYDTHSITNEHVVSLVSMMKDPTDGCYLLDWDDEDYVSGFLASLDGKGAGSHSEGGKASGLVRAGPKGDTATGAASRKRKGRKGKGRKKNEDGDGDGDADGDDEGSEAEERAHCRGRGGRGRGGRGRGGRGRGGRGKTGAHDSGAGDASAEHDSMSEDAEDVSEAHRLKLKERCRHMRERKGSGKATKFAMARANAAA